MNFSSVPLMQYPLPVSLSRNNKKETVLRDVTPCSLVDSEERAVYRTEQHVSKHPHPADSIVHCQAVSPLVQCILHMNPTVLWGGVEPSPVLLGPLLAYCTAPDDGWLTMMSAEQSMEWLAGETEVFGENMPQCLFINYKSHMTWNTGRGGGKRRRLTAWDPFCYIYSICAPAKIRI
jgi:hypothetical protein